jgi:hypothetical protein
MNRLPLNRLLYILVAIMLLMQSFAIWHDAEHPFHTADSQCERFEALGHTPSTDSIQTIPFVKAIIHRVGTVIIEQDEITTRQYGAYSIRAPPGWFC